MSKKQRVSYWDGTGKHQRMYDILWDALVPSSGQSSDTEGELIRGIGRLMYEYGNNGNCNAIDCDRGKVSEYYEDILNNIEYQVPNIEEECEEVRELIVGDKNYNYSYSQKELDVYNRLMDKVILHVLHANNDRHMKRINAWELSNCYKKMGSWIESAVYDICEKGEEEAQDWTATCMKKFEEAKKKAQRLEKIYFKKPLNK